MKVKCLNAPSDSILIVPFYSGINIKVDMDILFLYGEIALKVKLSLSFTNRKHLNIFLLGNIKFSNEQMGKTGKLGQCQCLIRSSSGNCSLG